MLRERKNQKLQENRKILNFKVILELILEVYILHIASKKTCGVTLEDDKVIEILAKEVKQCNLMLEFEKGNRQDSIKEDKS